MATDQNWLKAKFRVEFDRAAESARFFKRLIRKEGRKGRAELRRLAKKVGAVLPEEDLSSESSPHPPPGPLVSAATLRPQREGEARKRNTANQRIPWDPGRPELWNKRLVDAQLAKPEVRETYFEIRRAVWDWPEFASLGPGARAVLEVVIELARDEAFPWYVMVPSHEVRRLARLSEGSFARCVRELSCFVVSRPAKVVKLTDDAGVVKMWPAPGEAWEVEDAPRFDRDTDEFAPHPPPGPLPRRDGEKGIAPSRSRLVENCAQRTNAECTVPQFVLLYRRGIPWNAKRAAWWINYDLLCGTGVVMPCFVMSLTSLPKTYQGRNEVMGAWPGVTSDAALDALRAGLGKYGPTPEVGMRAALWTRRAVVVQ